MCMFSGKMYVTEFLVTILFCFAHAKDAKGKKKTEYLFMIFVVYGFINHLLLSLDIMYNVLL